MTQNEPLPTPPGGDGAAAGATPAARTALRLSLAMTRLRSRLRVEAGITRTGLSISQISVLLRILNEGPVTAAALAAAEHVSPQSIAQNVATLKQAGLVAAQPDPSDGRKTQLRATDAGRELSDSLHESRIAWLTRAVEELDATGEREQLEDLVGLLERLAVADPEPAPRRAGTATGTGAGAETGTDA